MTDRPQTTQQAESPTEAQKLALGHDLDPNVRVAALNAYARGSDVEPVKLDEEQRAVAFAIARVVNETFEADAPRVLSVAPLLIKHGWLKLPGTSD
ncbi:MAG: hypothetical protein AAGH92_08630 [Planctomycetota bacterium]